jgi:hypothetical protein
MARENKIKVSVEVVDKGGLRELLAVSRGMRDIRGAGREMEQGLAGTARAFDTTTRSAGGLSTVLKGFVAGAVGGAVVGFFKDAASAAIDFAKASSEAGQRAADAFRFMESSAKLTGTSINELVAGAEKLRIEFGLSRTDAQQLIARAEQFATAAGRSGQGLQLIRTAADALVSSGRSLADLPETIRLLSAGGGGIENALDRLLGGKNPEAVFKERFAQVGAAGPGSLTDQQQKLAVLIEIMERGGTSAGAASARMADFGAKTETLSARLEDLQAAVGGVINRSEGLNRVVDKLIQLTEVAGKPENAKSIERMGVALGGLAAAGAIGIGSTLTGLQAIVTAVDLIAVAAVSTMSSLQLLARGVSAAFRLAGAEAVEGLTAALGPAGAKLFGLGDVSGLKVRARAELEGVFAEGAALASANTKILAEDLRRFAEIAQGTAGFARDAFGAGGFRREGLRAIPRVTQPGDTRSVDTGLRAAGLANLQTVDLPSIAEHDRLKKEAAERAKRLAEVQDRTALGLRALADFEAQVLGRSRGPNDTDFDRLFGDALSGGDAARQRLLEAARGGQIDFGGLTGGQRDLIQQLISDERLGLIKEQLTAEEELRDAVRAHAAITTGNTTAIYDLGEKVGQLIAKDLYAKLDVNLMQGLTAEEAVPAGGAVP